MSKPDKKKEKPLSENHDQKSNDDSKELPEDKLKSTEEKLLRT